MVRQIMSFLLPPEAIANYIQRRKVDLAALQISLDQGAVKELNHVGHQILGNAQTFGFLDLEEIGRKLNDLTEQSLKEMGPVILSEFKSWILDQSSTTSVEIPVSPTQSTAFDQSV